MRLGRATVSRRVVVAAVVGVLLAAAAGVGVWRAATADGPRSVEARTEQIASTLRCPTCQNLSVADSDSQMARGMRDTIAEQLASGRNAEEIRGYFVDRYGEWVLLSPEREGFGWVVWLLPVAGLGLAGVAAAVIARRHGGSAGPTTPMPPALDATERERVEQAATAFADGTLAAPDTVAGERLESALVLLETVRADEDTSPAVEVRAEHRVLATLDELEAEPARVPATLDELEAEPAPVPATLDEFEAEPARVAEPVGEATADPSLPTARPSPAPGPEARGWRRRPVVWSLVGGAFATVLVVALLSGLQPRGAGELPTGGISSGQETSEQDGGGATSQAGEGAAANGGEGTAADGGEADHEAEIAELRETLADDPDDTRSRLLLAVRLLESGRAGEAESEAARVLESEPGQADGLLVLGLAQASQQDPAAPATLERFLDRAPAEHPGIEMARTILDRAGSGGGARSDAGGNSQPDAGGNSQPDAGGADG